MILRWIIIGLLVCTQAIAYADEVDKDPATQDSAESKAREFIHALFHNSSERVYAFFDQGLKETTSEQLDTTVKQIRTVLPSEAKISLYKKIQYPDQDNSIGFIYDISDGNRVYELSISMVRRAGECYVDGFHIRIKPRKLFNLSGASLLHYLILILFTACIVVQIFCFLFFITRKNLSKKWLYALSSFIGFPFGIGMNWTTGVFIFRIGFNVPAVVISAPVTNLDMWTVSVFFPLGLFFMIIVLRKSCFLNSAKE